MTDVKVSLIHPKKRAQRVTFSFCDNLTLYCQTKTDFFVGKLNDVGCLGWPEFSSPIFTALLGLI